MESASPTFSSREMVGRAMLAILASSTVTPMQHSSAPAAHWRAGEGRPVVFLGEAGGADLSDLRVGAWFMPSILFLCRTRPVLHGCLAGARQREFVGWRVFGQRGACAQGCALADRDRGDQLRI